MAGTPIRVGVVGANVERGWAKDAHLPALRSLEGFTLAGVSARTQQGADRAAAAFGATRGFGDSLAMVRDPSIDLVTVAVKVPEHRAVVLAALAAGKHVYCEWPLGRDVAESEEMAAAAARAGTHVTIGLQGTVAPAVRDAAALVQSGAIGQPLRLRVVSPTAGWGAETPAFYAYLQDKANGATLLTITGGHTLAMMESVVGSFVEIEGRASILRPQLRLSGTDTVVDRTCADHATLIGRHASGCISSLEVVAGTMKTPFAFELEGSLGTLSIIGGHPGGYQVGVLTVETSVPAAAHSAAAVAGLVNAPANVSELYARLGADIRNGTRTVPDFTDAVHLAQLLDSIETASESGTRLQLAPRSVAEKEVA